MTITYYPSEGAPIIKEAVTAAANFRDVLGHTP